MSKKILREVRLAAPLVICCLAGYLIGRGESGDVVTGIVDLIDATVIYLINKTTEDQLEERIKL